MRIAMLCANDISSAFLDGSAASSSTTGVAALCLALSRQGHDVVVHCPGGDAFGGDLEIGSVQVCRVGGVHEMADDARDGLAGEATEGSRADRASQMRALGRAAATRWSVTGAPDVVHAHDPWSGVAAAEAAQFVCAPWVLSWSPSHEELKSSVQPDAYLVSCATQREALVGAGVGAERVWVVPHGVDLDTYRLDAACEAPPRTRIVTMDSLAEANRVDVLVRALLLLPGAELVVGGRPGHPVPAAEVDRLRELADSYGVLDRVDARGSLTPPETARLLGSAHVVVCTGSQEGPNSPALAAMACGRPVLASAEADLGEVLQDGVTGFRVAWRHAADMAMSVEDILADTTRAAEVSATAREGVESRHGWNAVARRTLEVYVDARPRRGDGGRRATRDRVEPHVIEVGSADGWAARQAPRAGGLGHLPRGSTV